MGPCGEKKERSTKNNPAAHSRERKDKSRWQSWMGRSANCSTGQESLENSCADPMRHAGAKGVEEEVWIDLPTKKIPGNEFMSQNIDDKLILTAEMAKK